MLTNKRYKRLARAVFCGLYNDSIKTVEQQERMLRIFASRDKSQPDWENRAETFKRVIGVGFRYRHKPTRQPVYEDKEKKDVEQSSSNLRVS